MTRKSYAIKVVLASLIFVPVNLVALYYFVSTNIQWWHILSVIAALAVVDILIIVLTGKPSKLKDHANST